MRQLCSLSLLFLLCLGLPSGAWAAAVAFDAACAGGGTSSPATCSNTGSASATAAVCFVNMADTTDTVSGCTYGGSAMTLDRSTANYSSGGRSFVSYTLINPPTGTQTCSAAFSGTNRHNIACATFTGTAERVINSTSDTGSNNDTGTLAVTATDATNGLTVVGFGINTGNNTAAGTGETERASNTGGSSTVTLLTADANGSNTFTETNQGAGAEWVGHGFSIEPNATGTCRHGLALLGAGC